MDRPLLSTLDLAKAYQVGDNLVRALAGVSVDVQRGEFVAVMGPSGSGKSTFMNLIGCLDRPSAGEYRLDGQPVSALDADALAAARNRHIGFVFQSFNLLARTSALENVELPLVYAGVASRERRARAADMLARVGLAGRAGHLPQQLSGGQQQRVAIARAIATEPAVILADEPTGNLDTARSREIMALLVTLNRTQGITIVMVTHEADMAQYAQRIVQFVDGLVASDRSNPRRD